MIVFFWMTFLLLTLGPVIYNAFPDVAFGPWIIVAYFLALQFGWFSIERLW